MDFNLNEEQRAFQDAARAFAEGEMAPHAAEWDEEKIFPRDTIAAAGAMGFCGMYSPEAQGGMGMSRLDATIVLEELAAACSSTAAFISIHNMATSMVAEYGNDETLEQFSGELISGRKLASYCLTEAGAGSDAGSLATRAEKQGDHYVVNGSKMFISGAGATDVLVVMVRTEDSGARGISTLVIPADSPGISFSQNLEKMGWHSQPTCEITFDNVHVPMTNRLANEGDGFKIAMKGLDGGRIGIASCSIGTAQAALNRARDYMLERKQFGEAIANFQALQFKLADMVTELVAARQMVRLAAFKLDKKDPDATTYSAMAKRFATDVGFEVCNQALQIHGGYGYMQEYPLERYMRDTRVHQILEGTNEIMRLIVSRRLLSDAEIEAIQ